jgi:hypothetical protein
MGVLVGDVLPLLDNEIYSRGKGLSQLLRVILI